MCDKINSIIKDIINSFPTKYINISHLDDTIWINKSYLRINISSSGKNVINNHTKIDVLEDCENKLKEYYNIPENASLIKLIFEKKEEGTNSFKPEYEIGYLLNGSYIKLDTSICNNIIEDINNKIPTFSLHDNLDGLFELNPMSNHYDDICSTSTTENSTDMPLLDRKNDFCGENCVPYYNINNNSIKCTCFINNKTQNIEDKSEKDKLSFNIIVLHTITLMKHII